MKTNYKYLKIDNYFWTNGGKFGTLLTNMDSPPILIIEKSPNGPESFKYDTNIIHFHQDLQKFRIEPYFLSIYNFNLQLLSCLTVLQTFDCQHRRMSL